MVFASITIVYVYTSLSKFVQEIVASTTKPLYTRIRYINLQFDTIFVIPNIAQAIMGLCLSFGILHDAMQYTFLSDVDRILDPMGILFLPTFLPSPNKPLSVLA